MCVKGVKKVSKEDWEIQTIVKSIFAPLVVFFKHGLSAYFKHIKLNIVKPYYAGFLCVYMNHFEIDGYKECNNFAKPKVGSEYYKWLEQFDNIDYNVMIKDMEMDDVWETLLGVPNVD